MDVDLKVEGKCAEPDDVLFANMEAAIARGLPEVLAMRPIQQGVIVIAASGPGLAKEVQTLRLMQEAKRPIVAVRGAHDFLIDHGIIPDFATTVDPLPDSWTCFMRKAPGIQYMIASQCPAEVFDHLADRQVTIWHPYIMKGQTRPKDRMWIGGGTTSGLRAIALFYAFGWRHFALFGFDSCLDGETLRFDGTGVKSGDDVKEIRFNGKSYWCNSAMALQAQSFQIYYEWMPDAHFYAFGQGLIPDIIRAKEALNRELWWTKKEADNGRISFIHKWNEEAASYRYRASIPAAALSASLNDLSASTLVFSKPQSEEIVEIARAKARGSWVVVDFCDDHFDWPYYSEILRLADAVTCPTEAMAAIIQERGREATVIPDPYEYPEREPHCAGDYLLWFGHGTNKGSLDRILPDLEGRSLHVVSNFAGALPWSRETILRELAEADIVILPATELYKSANRAVEAIRQGCFVVAEPHPAWNDIPGIWIGNIKEGIEWAIQHLEEANQRTSLAQKYVMGEYSPKTVAAMWKTAIQRPSTSVAEANTGTAGSISTVSPRRPISDATCDPSPLQPIVPMR
jgi:uncharacterized Rossmann fold enzyme